MNSFPASLPASSRLPPAGAERALARPLRLSSIAAALALGGLVVLSLVFVLVAAQHSSMLTPTTQPRYFPDWMVGPLAGLWPEIPAAYATLNQIVNVGFLVMFACYVVAWRWAPALGARWTIVTILLVHIIFFLSPPLALTDVFNYINYARMGVVHHLNPYATIPALEPYTDPSFPLSNWHHLLSPYGPLFTLMMYVLVPLGVPASFWAIKLLVCAYSLGLLALVWRCAERLGRSPISAVVFAGLNPVVLVWGLGGDHYDFLLMFVIMLGVYLALDARRAPLVTASHGERGAEEAVVASTLVSSVAEAGIAQGQGSTGPSGKPAHGARDLGIGAAFVSAVAIKASAGLLLPIVLGGVGRGRRRRVAVAMALTALVLALVSLVAFGARLPDLSEQSSLVTSVGPANVLGLLLGLGGETAGLRDVLFALALGAAALCSYWAWSGRRSWYAAAGLASFVLVLTLSWTVPWYVLWVLPFAALAATDRLRYAALALSLYFILTFSPMAGSVLNAVNIHPGSTPLGERQAAIFNELVH